MSTPLELLPAVDIADGTAVRLTQGAAGTETSYGNPVDAAADWAARVPSGFTWSIWMRRLVAAKTAPCCAVSSVRCQG